MKSTPAIDDGGRKIKEMKQDTFKIREYAVTGTLHGSIVYCSSEGEARRIFHRYYKGESIIHVRLQS